MKANQGREDAVAHFEEVLDPALSVSIDLGLQSVPEVIVHIPTTLKLLLASGLLPAASIATLLISCCQKYSVTEKQA